MYAYTKDRQTSTMDSQLTPPHMRNVSYITGDANPHLPEMAAGEKGDGSEELVRRKMLVHLVGVRLAQAA